MGFESPQLQSKEKPRQEQAPQRDWAMEARIQYLSAFKDHDSEELKRVYNEAGEARAKLDKKNMDPKDYAMEFGSLTGERNAIEEILRSRGINV